jgi:succinyl-diaminopimelate desuccinylase
LNERRAESAADPEFEKLLQAVLRHIDREELARLAQELVRIPSVYRPEEAEGNEARVARFLTEYLEREGLDVSVEAVAPGTPL